MGKINILLIEDDNSIAEIIKFNLKAFGFQISYLNNAEEALEIIDINRPDLIILDWMLPNMSGISLARTIKKKKDIRQIPIIMLTARTDEEDKIKGFESGIDDYISKPFSPSELNARIKAVLRRTNPSLYLNSISYKDIVINLMSHKVTRNNQKLKLSPKEFKILLYFMEHPNQVFTREQLLDHAWGRDNFVEIRTVDVHIRRLRKAINIKGLEKMITTVRTTGYSME